MQLSNRLSSPEQKTSRHSSVIDGLWIFRALAVGAAGVAVYYFTRVGLVTEVQDLRAAVNTLVGASATLLGFLVSAGALLYAVSNTTLARNLQRTGHFNRLLEDLFIAAGAFLVALMVGMLCLFLPATPFGEVGITKLGIG